MPKVFSVYVISLSASRTFFLCNVFCEVEETFQDGAKNVTLCSVGGASWGWRSSWASSI